MENTVDVRLEHGQKLIKANEPITYMLTPVSSKDSVAPLVLEEVHTKDIHLVVVSEDLSFFRHEHPQKQAKGYSVSLTFPFGGKFFLYSDIKPLAGSPVVVKKTVLVAGEQKEALRYGREVLSANVEDVQVQLEVNNGNAIKVHIQRNGTFIPASSLGDFLGAKAHVVMIPLDTKEYLHVHPMVHNDQLMLHFSSRSKGITRAWLQFLLDETLYTFDFVLLIKEIPLTRHHH